MVWYLRPGALAWLALGVGVVVYNSLTRDGEMLSEAADRAIASHPLLARVAVGAVAVHVANGAPARIDPIHWAFTLVRRGKKLLFPRT